MVNYARNGKLPSITHFHKFTANSQMYKTVSFPKYDSGTGAIERLRLAVQSDDSDFKVWLSQQSSKDIRSVLRSSYVELQVQAAGSQLPLSQLALDRLSEAYRSTMAEELRVSVLLPQHEQILLFPHTEQLGRHGTFSPNHLESIHRWYPYIEGFSSTFVRNLIAKWGANAASIYDPFAGTGTTVTVGAQLALNCYYSEINPFMRLVIEGKTNVLWEVAKSRAELQKYFAEVIFRARTSPISTEDATSQLRAAFSERQYFSAQRLVQILSLRSAISEVPTVQRSFKHLALLALGSIAVQCSELKRASDLRYRTPKELLPNDFDVIGIYEEKASHILADVNEAMENIGSVTCLGDDALNIPGHGPGVELIVTSPPYLNGTNYFRNTKIELWLTSLISSERDLGRFTRSAVTAGINNVSDNGRAIRSYDYVEVVAKQLDEVAYDRRIPELVRRYCSDAETWLRNCLSVLSPGGKAVVDIGDSRFAGVHVPTDTFLERIAEKVGFTVAEVETVRNRTSKDGSRLKQVLLILERPSGVRTRAAVRSPDRISQVASLAKEFATDLPHQREPYAARNWGHSLHSLCSYQGKLKPAVAHFLVSRFTSPGDTVLDPMSGAGTIPLESFLLGRKALANDIQELAFILSSAKVRRPSRDLVITELERLLKFVEKNWQLQDPGAYSAFGFNGKIPDYFESRTLKELLAARRYITDQSEMTCEKALVLSSLLHVLHGNRPYALSRRSHPVTPLRPTGAFEYRDIRSRLTDKVVRALESHDDRKVQSGVATYGSFEKLNYRGTVDAVITSPPFAASTKFYMANWLRLWMSGWEPSDFEQKKEHFVEHLQRSSFDIYAKFFQKCHQWLRPQGIVVLHLGKTKKHDMALELTQQSAGLFDVAYTFDENVVGREKFGLRDQGATKAHQYLFLVRRD
jgi:DNA modification methylase